MATPLLNFLGTAAKTIGTDMYTNGMNAFGSYLGGLVNEHFADRARQKNFETNEKAAENADKRQRAQYHDLYSPQALMNQYQAAGLSTSMLMSGGQSAVGQSSAQGNMSDGGSGGYPAPSTGNALAYAQIANINADTKVKEQQAINLGADTEFTMANILKAAEETENYKQRNLLLVLDREKRQLEIDLQKATNPEEIKQCLEKTEQMYKTTEQLKKENKSLDLDNEFNEKTMQTRIKQLAQEYKTEIAKTALNWANVNLSKQQVQSLIDTIAINQQNSKISEFNSRTQRLEILATIQQWTKENGFKQQELKQGNTKIWCDFATNVFGSICNLAGSLGSAALNK